MLNAYMCQAIKRFSLFYLIVLHMFFSLPPSAIANPTIRSSSSIDFNVPEGPADESMMMFAQQANLTLVYPFESIEQLTTNKVIGTYGMLEAANLLLANTGLTPTLYNNNLLIVTSAADSHKSITSVLEEINVTGVYHKSTSKALSIKHRSANIVDAIASLQFGKMPDENVAEALQRLPGISITRIDGEGSNVNIRGLGSDLNRVTLNGTTLTSNNVGRGYNFTTLSADLFDSIEVVKTPSADHDEGSIGGSINLRTLRPLDLEAPLANIDLQSRYNEYSKKENFSGGASYANKYLNDSLGIATTISYENRFFRTDTAQTFGWLKKEVVTTDGHTINGFMIDGLVPRLELKDRKRLGITFGIQYQPNDLTEIYADIAHMHLETKSDLNQVIIRFRNPIDGTFEYDKSSATPLFTRGQFSKGNSQSLFREWANKTNNKLLAIGAKREIGSWHLSTNAGYSKTKNFNPYNTTARYLRFQSTGYDLTANVKNPGFNADLALTNPANVRLAELSQANRKIDDIEKSAQFDIQYKLADYGFTAVKFGIKYKHRSKERRSDRAKYRPQPRPLLQEHQGAMIANHFMDGIDGGYGVDQWASVNFDKLLGDVETNLNPLAEEKLDSFHIEEQSLATYAKLSLEIPSKQLEGDIGLRIVNTDTRSFGNQLFSDDNILPKVETNQYRNYLPSFNLIHTINHETLLRVGLGRVMARPAFADIAPSLTYNNATGIGETGNPFLKPFIANQIDISWEWYFNDDNLLALGLFYKDISSFTYKTITPIRISTDASSADTSIFAISVPDNGKGGQIQGLELNFQQNFSFLPGVLSGLGVSFNYTYADSKATFLTQAQGINTKLPFPKQSKHTANASIYWENRYHSLYLAYNYRTDYLNDINNKNALRWSDSYGQLDASANFRLSEKLTLSIQAINLMNEIPYRYYTFLEEGNALNRNVSRNKLADYKQTGRQFRIGVRAEF